jgi:hypothetical protein
MFTWGVPQAIRRSVTLSEYSSLALSLKNEPFLKSIILAPLLRRFEMTFGIKADTLLRMQTTYELAQARKHEQDIKVQKFAKAA